MAEHGLDWTTSLFGPTPKRLTYFIVHDSPLQAWRRDFSIVYPGCVFDVACGHHQATRGTRWLACDIGFRTTRRCATECSKAGWVQQRIERGSSAGWVMAHRFGALAVTA